MATKRLHKLAEVIIADSKANSRDPKAISTLFMFRLCQHFMQGRTYERYIGTVLSLVYRAITELILGQELRPKTKVGPGLTIYHGFGLVVNDHAVIGANVTLRNGVTIGHKHAGGGSPVLEDGVSVGAGATLLGEIVVGRGATIGAGAVVLTSVPAGETYVGNPAKALTRKPKRDEQNGSVFT